MVGGTETRGRHVQGATQAYLCVAHRLSKVARYRSVEDFFILAPALLSSPVAVVGVMRPAVFFGLVDLALQPLQVTTAIQHRSPAVFLFLEAGRQRERVPIGMSDSI